MPCRRWHPANSNPVQPVSRYNLPMQRSAAEILEEARRLPSSEFDWLMAELLQVGGEATEAEVDASWKAEADRRVAEFESGAATTYSWQEVEAPLRGRLAR